MIQKIDLKPKIHWVDSIFQLDRSAWNGLVADDPFLSYEFLAALERSFCIGDGTAWQPHYLTINGPQENLIAAVPLYLKYDSRGEFVFDWGWADAFERAGRTYYPKLLAAVPFTPATGNRLLTAQGQDRCALVDYMLKACQDEAEKLSASSIHVLFPTTDDCAALDRAGFLARKGCQFHWRNDSYKTFDDFLSTFSSAKRKKVRRERRRIEESNIYFDHLSGNDMRSDDWDLVYEFYSRTFLRRGRHPYLNRAFFEEISANIPDRLLVIRARYERDAIAAAICFRSDSALYGRYWGSLADFHSLHFETCYYQGIEYCIRNGLQLFEPGTQGEHKISRGFSPTETWSYHKILDAEFHNAVGEFLNRETNYVDDYMDELSDRVPFKQSD